MYNTIVGNQQSGVSSTQETFKAEDSTTTEKTAHINSDNISLSTRSQKLSAISGEFFSGKSFSSVDTAKLIDRVYEYGLISKSEYNTLNHSTTSEDGAKTDEPTSTASLQQFIDQFKQRMGKVDGFQESTEKSVVALKEALNNASTILNDVEQAKKSPDFKAVLTQSKQTLMEWSMPSHIKKWNSMTK